MKPIETAKMIVDNPLGVAYAPEAVQLAKAYIDQSKALEQAVESQGLTQEYAEFNDFETRFPELHQYLREKTEGGSL